MKTQNIDLLLENQSLKNEFAVRNLDLSQVFVETPDDLELENSRLSHLLDWVNKYAECRHRKQMESCGYDFPPIDPGIEPDSDWYRFERWMQGKPIRKTLREQLPANYAPEEPEALNDDELLTALDKLTMLLREIGISVDYIDDVPPRLRYVELLGTLDDEFELLDGGAWHLDGCTGYCPDCFQRPWCETGSQSCWSEDKEAGGMHLIEPVKKYVSASPISLAILQRLQAEQDKKFDEFRKSQDDRNVGIDYMPPDFGDNDELPF